MTSKDIGYQALHLLLLAVVVLMSTSCDNGRKQRLRMEIEKANRDLPAEVEGLGRLDSMALEEDAQFVAYYYTVLRENAQLNVDMINNNADMVKRKMLNTMLAGGKTTLDMFKRNKVGMRYAFKEEGTGKTAQVTITLHELDRALEQPLTQAQAADQALHDDLLISRQSLPVIIDDNLKVVDYVLEDDKLIYVIDVNERVYPLGDDFNMKEAKEGVMEELDASNPGLVSTVSHLKKTNRGLTYRYVGNITKTQVDVDISALELKTHFPDF